MCHLDTLCGHSIFEYCDQCVSGKIRVIAKGIEIQGEDTDIWCPKCGGNLLFKSYYTRYYHCKYCGNIEPKKLPDSIKKTVKLFKFTWNSRIIFYISKKFKKLLLRSIK